MLDHPPALASVEMAVEVLSPLSTVENVNQAFFVLMVLGATCPSVIGVIGQTRAGIQASG